MKRSEINAAIALAKSVFAKHGFLLPPWAHWTPAQWAKAGPEAEEIRADALGWDITDFGSGNFAAKGLTLFTLRNGNPKRPGDRKPYAEKIMLVRPGQVTPLHFHWHKMEDIINRGGGDLVVELWASTPEDGLDRAVPVEVSVDGIARQVAPGAHVRLAPGESITLPPRLYHAFWAERDLCMVGEVSMVNDDHTDNKFHKPVGRFPAIEEDAEPLHPLCGETRK